jgi:hypothetical protein
MGLGGRAKELLPPSPPLTFSCVMSLRVRVLALTILTSITVLSIFWSRLQVSQVSFPAIEWTIGSNSLSRGVCAPVSSSRSSRLNETLFQVAAIDPLDALIRKQVEEILDARISDGYFRRTHVSALRDQDRLMLAQISTPKHIPLWPLFKTMVREWTDNKRFDPQEAMHSLVREVKDPIVCHYNNRELPPENSSSSLNQIQEKKSKYRKCAVVGNSGILLKQSYGSFIDSHDMVMRLNNAQISGYEKFVGSKTTISFVNSNIFHRCSRRPDCFCHPYGMKVPIVLYICQVVHIMDVAVCRKPERAPLLVTDPRFDILLARLVKWYSVKEFMEKTGQSLDRWHAVHDGENFHYSSGMQAVMLALGICEEVDLFGFGKSDMSPHHYHTRQIQELGLHDYEAEYRIYEDLSQRCAKSMPFLNQTGFDIPPLHIFL